MVPKVLESLKLYFNISLSVIIYGFRSLAVLAVLGQTYANRKQIGSLKILFLICVAQNATGFFQLKPSLEEASHLCRLSMRLVIVLPQFVRLYEEIIHEL